MSRYILTIGVDGEARQVPRKYDFAMLRQAVSDAEDFLLRHRHNRTAIVVLEWHNDKDAATATSPEQAQTDQ
jgi:hypothetical protein